MPAPAFPTGLLPLLVFLGIVGLGLILKRILPAGTTIPLSKHMSVGLVSFGAIILILLITLMVVFVLKR